MEPTRVDLATRSLAAIESTAERTLVELRRVVGSLRNTSVGSTLGSLPTLAELPSLVAVARDAGLNVTFREVSTVSPVRMLDPATESTVVRTVQEGLTNVLKHAGAGARCAVRLTWAETSLHVTVHSCPPRRPSAPRTGEPGGWSTNAGLSGLAERAALVGGHLEAGPVGDGFALRLTVSTRTMVTR